MRESQEGGLTPLMEDSMALVKPPCLNKPYGGAGDAPVPTTGRQDEPFPYELLPDTLIASTCRNSAPRLMAGPVAIDFTSIGAFDEWIAGFHLLF